MPKIALVTRSSFNTLDVVMLFLTSLWSRMVKALSVLLVDLTIFALTRAPRRSVCTPSLGRGRHTGRRAWASPAVAAASVALALAAFLGSALDARADSPVSVAIGDASVVEGDTPGSVQIGFPVTRTGDLTATLTISYTTSNGTAMAGTDHTAQVGAVTFLTVSASVTITIPITSNTLLQGNRSFSLQLLDPPSSFANKVDFYAGVTPDSVAIGDFSGDGKPDLAVANQSSGRVSVLRNTTADGASTPTLASKVDLFTGSYPQSVAIGDFNGDGKPDLAVANYADDPVGTVSVFLNTTATGAVTPTFASRVNFATDTSGAPSSVAVADFNGDGKPDLAVANSGQLDVSVLLNTTTNGASTPTFASKADFTTGGESGWLAVGDLNGDGKPDLATANYDANTVSVLLASSSTAITITRSTATGTIVDDDAPTSAGKALGDGQSATISAAFPLTLTVALSNTNGSPVQGVVVTYTAPASGPGGLFGASAVVTATSDSSGRAAAPTFTANSQVGSYVVTATVGHGLSPLLFDLSNATSTTTTVTSSPNPSVYGHSSPSRRR